MGLGRSTLLVKLDQSSTYRIVPVHPDNQPLLGVAWQSCTYVDRSLPFRLRLAPKIFNAVADFQPWILYCNGVTFALHYLDDFLTFGPPGSELASTMRSQVEAIFNCAGVPIAHEKTVGPSTTLTFLGIEIDTDLFQLRLPREKVDKLQDLLAQWRRHRSCTKRDLQSLLGHLSHAATTGSHFSMQSVCSPVPSVTPLPSETPEFGNKSRHCMVAMSIASLELLLLLSASLTIMPLLY